MLRELRPKVKAAMVREARRDPAWLILRSIPFLGPVRVALLLATMRTPWWFRTKRNLWAYCGLAAVSFSSSDYTFVDGRPVRRRRVGIRWQSAWINVGQLLGGKFVGLFP